MWRKITFAFSRPLTEKEELLFIRYIRRIAEGMKQKIEAGASAYNHPVLQGAATITGTKGIANNIKTQMQFVLSNFFEYVRLESADKTTYNLKIHENAMQIRAPTGHTINIWERFQRKFSLRWRLEICKELGLMPGELKISYGEDGG